MAKVIKYNEEKNKAFIIPTDDWLQPIKPFKSTNVNSKSLIMFACPVGHMPAWRLVI
jgi:hypothetical protein